MSTTIQTPLEGNVTLNNQEIKPSSCLELYCESVCDVLSALTHSTNKENTLSFDPFDPTTTTPLPLQDEATGRKYLYRYYLPGNLQIVSGFYESPVFQSILDGKTTDIAGSLSSSLEYYKEKVLQVDPFAVLQVEIRCGPTFAALPHQFAAMVGNVSYLNAIVELLKTPEDFKNIVNFEPLNKDPERLRLFNQSKSSDVKAEFSTISRYVPSTPVNDPSSYPNAGKDLLRLTLPGSMRGIDEFACRSSFNYGGSPVLKFLHRHNMIDPTRSNNNDTPPVLIACQSEDEGNLKFLHDHYSNTGDGKKNILNWVNETSKESLVHRAAANGNYGCLKYLLESGGCTHPVDAVETTPGSEPSTPFSACCYLAEENELIPGDSLRCLELLMSKGAHLYCLKERKLCIGGSAAVDENLSKKLIKFDDGIGNDQDDNKGSYTSKIETLLESKHLYFKLKYFPPLMVTNIDEFKKFCSKHLSSNKDKTVEEIFEIYFTTATRSTEKNHESESASSTSSIPLESIYTIPKSKTRQFYTSPLHCAASCGNVETVKFLCRNGFDIDKNVKAPNTPLYECIRTSSPGSTEIARFLIEELKVSLDDFNEGDERFTACYAASFLKNRTETLRLMLKNGANSSLLTSCQATPAFGAVFGENVEALKILVEFNSDLTTPFSGHSLLSYAKSMGNRADIVEYLEKIL